MASWQFSQVFFTTVYLREGSLFRKANTLHSYFLSTGILSLSFHSGTSRNLASPCPMLFHESTKSHPIRTYPVLVVLLDA